MIFMYLVQEGHMTDFEGVHINWPTPRVKNWPTPRNENWPTPGLKIGLYFF